MNVQMCWFADVKITKSPFLHYQGLKLLSAH